MLKSQSLRFGVLLGLFLANGTLGCEAQDCDNEETGAEGVCLKSLKRFDSAPETQSLAYTAGGDIVIDSPNGEVHVVEGDAGEVAVTFEPFVLRAHDITEEQAQEDLDSLERTLTENDDDAWIDVTRPDGSPSSLGADIVVYVPPEFTGTLDVRQGNGHTEIDFVGGAVGVLVASENGGCDVAAGAAEEISVHCENGDINASISDVAPQSGSGFSTENGSITLALPSDAVFSVQAAALSGGTVTAVNLPAECSLNAASDSAKTLSCNDATTDNPVYQVEADGTSLAGVVLTF